MTAMHEFNYSFLKSLENVDTSLAARKSSARRVR